jgi:PsbP-like protein
MRVSIVVAGAALMLGLAGCSGSAEVSTDSASPAASAEQSVPADVTTFTSDQYGFSFQYAPPFEEKSDVTLDAESGASSADSVAVFDTEGTQVGGQYRDAFVVNVYELNTEITADNLDQVQAELEQTVIPQLEQSSDNMQISELSPASVNGVDGFMADANFDVEGTAMTSQLYFLFDGAMEYQLLTQSATDRWTELQPTFEQMVNSFTVAAPAAAESPAS